MTINKKKTFLIVSSHSDRLQLLSQYINFQYDKPTIYEASSAKIGTSKLRNAPVDILVADTLVDTDEIIKMIETILEEKISPHMAILILGHPPEAERFVDELVTGKVFFLDEELKKGEFAKIFAKALNYNSHATPATFYLRYIAAGEILINEGDKAEYVYILKSGKLRAFNNIEGKKVVLGNVELGEFVGEMAYINNEPRSASIEALSDSQLIEVPIGLVDKVLYKRPAWSRALMQTLSKRLKLANKNSPA